MCLVYCATIKKKNPEKYDADTNSTCNTNDEAERLGWLKILNGNTLIMFYEQHCVGRTILSFSKFHSRCIINV